MADSENEEVGKQLTLHEAQVQACMCMNRILYLTQDPEIKSFFVSYVAGFSDFDAMYKELLQNLLIDIAPAVGIQTSLVYDATEETDEANDEANDAETEVAAAAPSAGPALRP